MICGAQRIVIHAVEGVGEAKLWFMLGRMACVGCRSLVSNIFVGVFFRISCKLSEFVKQSASSEGTSL
jgi:hypothetical protein